MKYLNLLFLLLPLTAQCQDVPKPVVNSPTEIGLNLGHALDNAESYSRKVIQHGGYIRSSLYLLKTYGNLQYGLNMEAGTNSEDDWYLSPSVVVNRKFSRKNYYFYLGGMAGFVCEDVLGEPTSWRGMMKGYVVGAQAGVVIPTTKRLAFNAEVGIRRAQDWQHYGIEYNETWSDIILYFPLTLGVRYRF